MPKKAPIELKALSFFGANPWDALRNRDMKVGDTTKSPINRQDQPKIYHIPKHTLEVLMHPPMLELHAVKVVRTPHGDER